MNFVDSIRIYASSGKGGAGCMSFRREKFIEFGGPDGGDGGHGGSVYIQGHKELLTLYDLKLQPHQRAKNGFPGLGSLKKGRAGEDKVILVPFGTLVFNEQTDETVCEILDDKKILLLQGGIGGKGNTYYKSSVNKAPRKFQKGMPGEEMRLRFDLRLLADVGLVGFPNAGKSTFISKVSAAKPKIANYPFTTLVPNLGVVQFKNFKSFVIADIPGIIEGASEGAGLGHQFLKHISRTSLLAFLVDCSLLAEKEPIEMYEELTRELEKFSDELVNKQRIVILTKIDSLDPDYPLQPIQEYFKEKGIEALAISSITGKGVEKVKEKLYQYVFPETTI